MVGCSFQGIRSESGFGLFSLEGIQDSANSIIEHNSFINLSAPVGAFLHWEDKQPTLLNNSFHNVTASIYGNQMAGYPTRLVIISEEEFVLNSFSPQGTQSTPLFSSSLNNLKSGSVMPSLYVAVVDSLNQIVRSLSPAPIQLIFEESISEGSPLSSIAHFVSRKNEVKWTLGAFIIENTTLVGEPGKHYSLKI